MHDGIGGAGGGQRPDLPGQGFAGRTVLIESTEPRVWLIKTARTIPDAELWLHQPEAANRLDRALVAIDQPSSLTDLDALEQHLSHRR